MLQKSQEERSELAILMVKVLEIILGQQLREEFLRQILGVGHAVSLAANVSIDGWPISSAEFFHGLIRGWRIATFGRQHHAPVRGGKDAPRKWKLITAISRCCHAPCFLR